MAYIDITLPLEHGKSTYPTVPPFEVKWLRRLEEGDNVSVSSISMAVHAGTHVDTPAHVFQKGALLDGLELWNLIGGAKVIDVSGEPVITQEKLATQLGELNKTKIVLLKTGFINPVETGGKFDPSYAYMDEEAASFLTSCEIKTVGLDTPNVDRYGDTSMRIHKILLGAGLIVVENLRLHHVPPGNYEFLGLPLKLKGVEAAPLRAILL